MVEASREFVCVRPQTYEDAREAEFLQSLFRGRNNTLENTVFCVLGPDGKQRLSRAGRSPARQFEDAAELARFLDRSFEPYSEDAQTIAGLPLHDELSLALNVAACDLLPLVVLYAEDEAGMKALQGRVAKLAWSDAHIGRQHFVVLIGEVKSAAFESLELEPGLTVIQPDPFGLSGEVLVQAALYAKAEVLAAALTKGRAAHDPAPKSRREHVRDARRKGITWDSELPVSDPDERKRR